LCHSFSTSSFLVPRHPPRPTLFPYTTLFRSLAQQHGVLGDDDFGFRHATGLSRTRPSPDRARCGHRGGRRAPKAYPRARAIRCRDRKSTRLNSSHVKISYAVFCLKKKKKQNK